jgi:hypothetical protein
MEMAEAILQEFHAAGYNPSAEAAFQSVSVVGIHS